MTDFSPAQMQEMARVIRRLGHIPQPFPDDVRGVVAKMLEQAASQAAEIERLKAENVCDACLGTGEPISAPGCMCEGTGKMSHAATYLRVELVEERAAKEAAESRLLALREQIEGLPRIGWKQGEGMVYMQDGIFLKRADVLALFDPAQEQP